MYEETKDINGFKITLPVGWGYDPKANRDDYASYITEERGWREIMHHLHALTTVLSHQVTNIASRNVKLRVLHAFGGLGATAQVIRQVDPKAEHTFWERSEKCCEYLLSKGWGNVTKVEDSMKYMRDVDLGRYHVIIFDPSLGTILSPGIIESWDYMSQFTVPLTWVSDFATSKLHLNGKAYGRVFGFDTPTPELYAEGYDKFLRSRGRGIIEAIRDSFEMYFAIKMKTGVKFPYSAGRPVPKMA